MSIQVLPVQADPVAPASDTPAFELPPLALQRLERELRSQLDLDWVEYIRASLRSNGRAR